MKYTTLNWITTEHHTSKDLSTCLVFNPATYQWLPLGLSLPISGVQTDRANDIVSTLHNADIECYIVTAKQLTKMLSEYLKQTLENS